MSTSIELSKLQSGGRGTGSGRRRSSVRPAAARPEIPSPPDSVYIPSSKQRDVHVLPSLPASATTSAAPSTYPSMVDLKVFADDEKEDGDEEVVARGSNEIDPRPATTDNSGRSSPEAFDIDAHAGERELQSLPPVDGGWDAWTFLAAGLVVEGLVWGIPWSVGVMHNYWATQMFPGKESTLTLAATLQTGLMYMTAAIGPIFTTLPQYTKHLQYGGLFVASIALIASAFVTEAYHLIITLGIFYPFAGATYLPCATLLYEWFHTRRGLATGIMFAGTGLGGTIFPFVVSGLLGRFGYKATMISLGVSFAILNGVALLFVKRRIPVSRKAMGGRRTHARSKTDWGFFKHAPIWLGIGVVLATSMGNFLPSLWIPSYAEAIHAKKPNGTALVALMNAASVPGNTLTGWLSDRYPTRIVVTLSCTLASIACLVLWGLGTSNGLLVGFSILWGFTALSFVGCWSKIITIISRDDPSLPTFAFSLFTVLKGVGNLTSGPISTALLSAGPFPGAKGAYGSTNYGGLLIYTGIMALTGGIPAVFFPTK